MAEYRATQNSLSHDGPRSYVDPHTHKSGNLAAYGDRLKFFGYTVGPRARLAARDVPATFLMTG